MVAEAEVMRKLWRVRIVGELVVKLVVGGGSELASFSAWHMI